MNDEERREKLRKKYGTQYVKDCPACSGVLYFRKGRYVGSIFIACSGFTAGCKHREPMLAAVPAPALADIERLKVEMATAPDCPQCGSRLRTVRGKNGPFLGCTKYPACHFTQNLPAPPVVVEDELVGRFE